MKLRLRTDSEKLIKLGSLPAANQVLLPIEGLMVLMPCGNEVPLAAMVQFSATMGFRIAIMENEIAYEWGPRFASQCRKILSERLSQDLALMLAEVNQSLGMVFTLGAEACPAGSPMALDRAASIDLISKVGSGLIDLAIALQRASSDDDPSEAVKWDDSGDSGELDDSWLHGSFDPCLNRAI